MLQRKLKLLLAGVCLLAQQSLASNITFSPHVEYGLHYPTGSVCVGDFDGEGNPDLAVVRRQTSNSKIYVLENNGDGTFAAGIGYNVDLVPAAVCSGDFDGDGNLDIAACCGYPSGVPPVYPGYVSILKNNGGGAFAPFVAYPSGGDFPISIVAADFDGDGRPDLAVANYNSNDVSVLKNNGNGTFAAAVNYPAEITPNWVHAADFNGDGKPDLATANLTGNTFSVLINNGNGTFGTTAYYVLGGGYTPYSLCSIDFDNDGNLDLAVVIQSTGAVEFHKNSGDGTFNPTALQCFVGSNPTEIYANDFDGDDRSDLAIASSGQNWVSILKNNGNGTFASADFFPVAGRAESVAGGDFDGDGRPELAVSNSDMYNISVLRNKTVWFKTCGLPNAALDQWPTFAHDYSRTSQSGISLGNPAGLKMVWNYSGTPSTIDYTGPVIADDRVFVAYNDRIVCLNLLTGVELWTTQTIPAYSGLMGADLSAMPTIEAGYIYFSTGSTKGFIKADAATGAVIWSRGSLSSPLPGIPGTTKYSPSIIMGNTIYFGDDNGQIYALDKASGADLYYSQLWADSPTNTIKGSVFTSPSTDGSHLFFSQGVGFIYDGETHIFDGGIHSVTPDVDSFTHNWYFRCDTQFGLGKGFVSSPSYRSGNLFTHSFYGWSNGGFRGYRQNLDPVTGVNKWLYNYPLGAGWSSPPTVGKNMVYFSSMNDASAVETNLESRGILAVSYLSLPAWIHMGHYLASDNNVYASAVLTCDYYLIYGTSDLQNDNGHLIAANAITGAILLDRPLDGHVMGTALAHGSDGFDYVVTTQRFSAQGAGPGAIRAYRNFDYLGGDANGDEAVNISDAVFLIAYIFSGGFAPNPLLSGDANCNSAVNISDAVYLIAYIFAGGPQPNAACK